MDTCSRSLADSRRIPVRRDRGRCFDRVRRRVGARDLLDQPRRAGVTVRPSANADAFADRTNRLQRDLDGAAL